MGQAQRAPQLAFLRRSSSPKGQQHTLAAEKDLGDGVEGAGAWITITDVTDPMGWQGCENCDLGSSSFCALSLSLDQEGVGHADLLCGRCSGRPVQP